MLHQIARVPIDHSHGMTLFVFGDLQSDADGFSGEAWEEFRSRFKATKNAWGIGLGDYNDWLRPSMRSRLQSSMTGDTSARQMQDDMFRKKQDDLIKRMDFLEGRLVGLHNGHHCWEFLSGENSDQRLASALKAPYLGWMASTRLILMRPNAKHVDRASAGTYTIVSMHGTGNARHATTDARWLEVNIVPGWGADHYVKGHACKSVAWVPHTRNEIRRNGPAGVEQRLVRCMNVPGFSNGYTDGWSSSYAERSGFLPQALGWGEIRFKRTQSIEEMQQRGLTNRKSGGIAVEQIIHNL